MKGLCKMHPTALEEENSCLGDDVILKAEPCRASSPVYLKLACWCQQGEILRSLLDAGSAPTKSGFVQRNNVLVGSQQVLMWHDF